MGVVIIKQGQKLRFNTTPQNYVDLMLKSTIVLDRTGFLINLFVDNMSSGCGEAIVLPRRTGKTMDAHMVKMHTEIRVDEQGNIEEVFIFKQQL